VLEINDLHAGIGDREILRGITLRVNAGEVHAGPMGVVGIDYKFDNAPINLSLDWKPELDIAPAINFIPDAFALSVRFTLIQRKPETIDPNK